MKKLVLYIGLVLLLIGGTCLVVGDVFFKSLKYESLGESDEGLWEYATNLTSGKSYKLIIYAPPAWNLPFEQVPNRDAMPVNMTITSPDGDVTKLQADFYGWGPSGDFESGVTDIVNIKYFNVSSALDVVLNVASIRFAARTSGSYMVRFLDEGELVTYGAPGSMEFFEELYLTRGIYNVLMASGGTLCVVGCIVSLWGAFGRDRIKHRKKRS